MTSEEAAAKRRTMRAEGKELCVRAGKLWDEADKLYNNLNRTCVEGDKLWDEGDRLWSKGRTLYAEGDILFLKSLSKFTGL